MKIRFVFSLLLWMASKTGNAQPVSIRGYEFDFRTEFIGNENGDSIKQVVLYRGNSRLLTHIISKLEGDCNSEEMELGAYQVSDTSIVFYSYWARFGDAPVAPFGVRKQTYVINNKGRGYLINATLYIETSREGRQVNNGIEYLFRSPRTQHERNRLKAYIKEVETAYKGRFVFGIIKNELFKEVRGQLEESIQIKEKEWDQNRRSE